MKKYTFFLDIDNTLLPSGKSRISDAVFDAIAEGKKHGSVFFINTARPRWLVPESEFPSEFFDGICSGCGTNIEFHGKTVYQSFVPKEYILKLASCIEVNRFSDIAMIIECVDKNFYFGKDIKWGIPPINQNVASVAELTELLSDSCVQKFCFNKAGESYPEEFLNEARKNFDTMIHPGYAEAVPYCYNKGTAIKITEKELCIPHESTVAIGDSLNDLDMLQYASVSVAMGNAPDKVKALCDTVTDTSANDGVAAAILGLISS